MDSILRTLWGRDLILVLAVVLVAPLTAALAADVSHSRPNVIVILADDLGYADVGYQGLGDIPTPNIDRLAQSGVRCTSGYVTWPACAPSRAAIVTGQDSHRFGFYTNPTPILAADQGLPPGIMTVPRAMQQHGYVTGGIGKWHLGTTPDRHPNRMGFAEWFGFLGGGHDYFPWEYYHRPIPKRPWPEWFVNGTLPILRNSEPVKIDRYLTDLFTDEAVAFIRRHKDDPFYLYLAYNAPHSPYEAPQDEEARFSTDQMAKINGIPAGLRRTYVAMVSKIDQGVARVLDALRENRLDQRTLLFFLSDNGGGKNVDEKGKPDYPSSNHPLRGYKGTLWEGGIRVPFTVAWKGTLPSGRTYDQPVSSLDVGATAIALAGGAPPGMHLDGVNLLPHLTGQDQAAPHERLFWKNFGQGAIREGRYKLITATRNARHELYDLVDDIGETKNLAAEKPDLVRRLDTAWQAWNAQMKPPLWKAPPPSQWTRPEYQPPQWPGEEAVIRRNR